jgi:hypothetical protein
MGSGSPGKGKTTLMPQEKLRELLPLCSSLISHHKLYLEPRTRARQCEREREREREREVSGKKDWKG